MGRNDVCAFVPLFEDDEDGVEEIGYIGFLLGGFGLEFSKEELQGLRISNWILCQDDAAYFLEEFKVLEVGELLIKTRSVKFAKHGGWRRWLLSQMGPAWRCRRLEPTKLSRRNSLQEDMFQLGGR